jgi:hypothetical protein
MGRSILIYRAEKKYQQIWCDHAQGDVEYRLPDKTRIDCLTATHEIKTGLLILLTHS